MLIDKLYLEDLLSIDKLHYKEVKIINDLHDALLSQDGDTASKKLKELVLDVEHHFSEEEKQMFKYNYEGGNKHQHAHGLALVQLYTARDEFNESGDIKALQSYLENRFAPWFCAHVMTLDREACDYMCEQGSN